MKLEHHTILITGGSSGIGRELARQLAGRGNVVIITGRDLGRLNETAAAIPDLYAIQCDLTETGAIARLYDDVIARFPKLNVVVNNAGIMRNIDLLAEHPTHDLTAEIAIGLSAPIQMVQQFLPHLRKQNAAAIVNITSGLAFVPMALSPVYCAAKAGLHSFTQSLRAQLAGSTIAVFEIAPPGVETPLFRAEFAEEMKDQQGMPVAALVKQLIAGIEANRPDTRPGLAKILYLMGRIAPTFMAGQLAKLGPKRVNGGAARASTTAA